MPSNKIDSSELLELKSFAEELAKKAGQIILKGRGKAQIVKQKDARDIATNVDIAAEELIVKAIREKYPTHSIFSEESGSTGSQSGFQWFIDPLDGTKQYFRNLPNFSCNICLTLEGDPIVSVVYFPLLERLYSAGLGLGVYIDGRKARMSKIDKLEAAYVYFYSPTKRRKYVSFEKAWEKIIRLSEKAYRVESESGISWGLSYLAQGSIEAFLNLSNPSLPHDILPGLLIAKEAGAKIYLKDNVLIAANNESIYNQIMEIIS